MIRFLDHTIDAVMAASMALAVVIGFTAVIFRYVIGSSLTWSFEVMLVLLTYMTFVGCYAALRRGQHLRVDVLVRMLPRIPQTIVFVAAQLLVLMVTLTMCWWGFEFYQRAGTRTLTMTDIPRAWVYIIIPLSGLAMTLDTLARLGIGLHRVARGQSPEVYAHEDSEPASSA